MSIFNKQNWFYQICQKTIQSVHYCIKNKYVRIALLFPVLFFIFSGFIHNEDNTVRGLLNTNSQLYPLTNTSGKDTRPSSGDIPLNKKVSTIFSTEKLEKAELSAKEEKIIEQLTQTSIKLVEKINNNLPAFIQSSSLSNTKKLDLEIKTDKYQRNTSKAYQKRKNSILPFANKYADKFGLDRNLVVSIIEVESNFRPHVVSHQNAHGLMQVVPSTAGAEVNRFFKHKGKVSKIDLMHPETNIYYGTAYLYLLRKFHLEGIEDHDSLNTILIASYNAGTGAILRHFGKSREEAIEKINSMSAKDVYDSITKTYRSGETREYVKRVTAYMS